METIGTKRQCLSGQNTLASAGKPMSACFLMLQVLISKLNFNL